MTGYVALTYDDGPTPDTAPRILAALVEAGAVATMFVTGQNVERHPDLVRAFIDAGMPLANHTWDHPHLTRLPAAQQREQILRTQDAVERQTGTAPVLFRAPFGDQDAQVDELVASLGLRDVWPDVDSRDYDGTPADNIRAAARGLTAGQIILLHDWPVPTAVATPGILTDLAERGLATGVVDPATGAVVAA